jgi:4-hydroxy-tetrahydrodipicolinate synthase
LDKGVNFIAGTYIEDLDGDIISLYRRQMDQIVAMVERPSSFRPQGYVVKTFIRRSQCTARHVEVIRKCSASNLIRSSRANGEIFDDETVRGLLEIPELKGLKHSSLDRRRELQRLALRDALRPDFRIYTGNDLGINMIEYGSDYLLGLATFAPRSLLSAISLANR